MLLFVSYIIYYMDKICLTFDLNVVQSSLGYVGTVKEIPVVVESPTIEELKEDISEATLIWLHENPAMAKEHLVIQVPA